MTGGFPAEYGNRFGGVIDIVTRSGSNGQSRRGRVQRGRRRTPARRRRSGWPARRFGYFVFGTLFESERFLSPPAPKPSMTRRAARTCSPSSTPRRPVGSLRANIIGDGTNFEIPRTELDVLLRPLANARQDTRQQTAIVGWTAVMKDVAVTASGLSAMVAGAPVPGRRSADGAGGGRTHAVDIRRQGRRDPPQRPPRIQGRHGCGVVAAGGDLAYSYAGYLEFTHLIALPHIHIANQFIGFAGADSGGQVSVYLQDSIQAGSRLTPDVGLRVDRFAPLVSETHASPRVNLAFRVAEDTVIHASYNHFFVPPPIEGVLSSAAGLTQHIEEIGVRCRRWCRSSRISSRRGVTTRLGPVQVGMTSYWRETDNPVHTTIWPDSRIYSYASFDRARAYGLEAKAEVTPSRAGVTGYLNYAFGRGHFQNPVTGGFVTEAAHITETNRFLAPMDQTHTMTAA